MLARSVLAIVVALIGLNGTGSHAFATEPAALPKEITGKDGAPLVLIPAGSYPMGVPTGDRDGGRDEYPRHVIQIDPFYIDKYEITNGRYLEFVKATNHRVPQNPKNPTRNLWEGIGIPSSLADRPVVNVDWADAEAYCTWAGRRLPREAEWEKAAKGNNDWRFPWGNVEPTDKHLNFNQKWIGEKNADAGRQLRGGARVPTASTTWRAMCGNGSMTGMTRSTMRRVRTRIHRDRRAARNESSEGPAGRMKPLRSASSLA